MKAMITGVGWVNSYGRGQGRQAVFNPGESEGRLDLSAKGVFDKPVPRFGRMDDYTRLGLLGIALAMQDAQLDHWTEMRNIAIMASTVYGCMQTDADYYDTVKPKGGLLSSPNLFAYTLSNTFLGEAAIYFGLTGAAFILHEPSISGIPGLILALEDLERKECEGVIVGICDTGTPLNLGLSGRAVPEALFFVLRQTAVEQGLSYGVLTQEKIGEIFFNGKKVENLQKLALWCTQKV